MDVKISPALKLCFVNLMHVITSLVCDASNSHIVYWELFAKENVCRFRESCCNREHFLVLFPVSFSFSCLITKFMNVFLRTL